MNKPYDPEDTFFCASCCLERKEYYRSEYETHLCIFCDPSDDYDDPYEDDSDSPWNE